MLDSVDKDRIALTVDQLLAEHGGQRGRIEAAIAELFSDSPEQKRFAEFILSRRWTDTATTFRDEGQAWVKFYKPDDLAGVVKDILPIENASGGAMAYYQGRSGAADVMMFLKVVRTTEETEKARHTAQMFQEYRAFNILRHPNILAVYDAGWARDSGGREFPFIASEFLDGLSLEAWRLQCREAPANAVTAEIGRVLAATLRSLLNIPDDVVQRIWRDAKGGGIVHLDVKPANAMVLRNIKNKTLFPDRSHLKLLDFGAAGTVETASNSGTRGYRSPERYVQSSERIAPNPSWDVFSLGAVLYFLRFGRDPMSVEGLTSEKWTEWLMGWDMGDADLTTIVRTCLAWDVSKRYRTAAEVEEDLDAYLRGLPLPHAKGLRCGIIKRARRLLSRCRSSGDDTDDSRLLSWAAGIVGALEVGGAVCYLLQRAAGRDLVAAVDTCGIALTFLVALPPLLAMAWMRRPTPAVRVYWPFIGVDLAFLGLRVLSQMDSPDVSTGSAVRAFFLQVMLLGSVANLFSCYVLPRQHIGRHVGWLVMAFSILLIWLGDQPWQAEWLPFFAWSSMGVMCFSFATQIRYHESGGGKGTDLAKDPLTYSE